MSSKDWYTFLSDPKDPNHFTCYVVDKDLDKVKQYEINGSICDCWAGNKWCRHKKMLVMFKQEQRINSRQYYNFDKEKWMNIRKENEL
jgi:hypothetical protein